VAAASDRDQARGRSCRCSTNDGVTSRRNVVLLGSAFVAAAALPAAAEPADERPQEGDFLVRTDGPPTLLGPTDISAPQVIAWPMDPITKTIRDGSRLNKVLLIRLDPATLEQPTQGRAADGVVGYSAICPHAGCEVIGWQSDQLMLECPCHNSRYNPRDAAAIVDGPTMRALASLPLKIVDGKLAVAKPFIGRLGVVSS
jgi:rieske iron-sulfur protein